ncbi:MAG: long-chain fatty acid--CoA ligase [Hyphomicrobiaceae bacterium]|nr:MAG: long-chain fatty acid--CoA ligase [Hyphomicrobiaceae bacterium]
MRLDTVLLEHCRRTPHKPAVVCGDRRVTFGELAESIRRIAGGLHDLGLRVGDRLVLYVPNSIEFVEAMFGALAAGAIVIPVTTRLTLNELAYFCRDSGAKAVVCHADSAAGVANILADTGAAGIVIGGTHAGMRAFGEVRSAPMRSLPQIPVEHDTSLVMYTSGTTGRPKGVELTHANILIQHGYMNGVEWRINADDRYLVVAPMAHRAGLGRLMNAMMLGGTLFVLKQFDAERIVETIERERITVFGMVPTMCRMLLPELEKAPGRCRSLTRIAVTGEAFPVELKQRLIELLPDTELVSFFGMTEAGGVTNLSHAEQFTHPESVGRPAPGVEARIVDANGRDVPTGEVGELAVRSGKPGAFTVMKQYFNRPQETADAIRDGWFFTGDLATMDGDGYISIVDRKKDMIVSGGLNIYSKEVELVIATMPGIAAVAVVGVPDPVFGEAVAAFIETAGSAAAPAPAPEAIIAHCREAIASYKKPKHVFYRPVLPRNAVGKVLKHELAAEARAALAAGAAGPESTRHSAR